ncbi:hypothetical protein [Rhodomicrobium lacus]|uniref:hypothetical protein n=1 Tax=Rhodomicrobium lacus TaxID=2498452 RepID=UPI000F8D8532|nr:hypothetical protein [Rhodomicrobium lacus]
MGKTLSPLINAFDAIDMLYVHAPTVRRGEASSIEPTAWFARKVEEFGVTLGDFGRDVAEELVHLTRNTRTSSESKIREPIEYEDDALTTLHRENLLSLNLFLKKADIDFLDDGGEPRVDPFDRTLRRRFVILKDQEPRFDQGGRLYGGFWQNLKSARRRQVRIDGEPVAVLDYRSMFTRLAYCELGATPPDGDLYAIPGAEGYRSGIKLAMNCFLFDGGPRLSWPAELGVGVGSDQEAIDDPEGRAAGFEARLPAGWTVGRTKQAILTVHPVLKAAWGKKLGYRLMFIESEIMIAILQALVQENIPALGLHDGLLVAMSRQDRAQEVMREQARRIAGASLPVSVKTVSV